jgi:hypothetical protein
MKGGISMKSSKELREEIVDKDASMLEKLIKIAISKNENHINLYTSSVVFLEDAVNSLEEAGYVLNEATFSKEGGLEERLTSDQLFAGHIVSW